MKDIAATDGLKIIIKSELMESNVLLIALRLDAQDLTAVIVGWTKNVNGVNTSHPLNIWKSIELLNQENQSVKF